MLGLEHTGWKDEASCIGLWEDFDLDEEGTPDKHKVATLRRICNECPVREKCLEDSLEYSDEFTFRGGMTPTERNKMMRLLGIPNWGRKQQNIRNLKRLSELKHGAGSPRWSAGCNCKVCTLVPADYRQSRAKK